MPTASKLTTDNWEENITKSDSKNVSKNGILSIYLI